MGPEGVKNTLFRALSVSANHPDLRGFSAPKRGRNANLGYSVALGGRGQGILWLPQ
jgi:hypothetical protein